MRKVQRLNVKSKKSENFLNPAVADPWGGWWGRSPPSR